MSVTDVSADEFFESLTGFDEIAIKRTFGVPISTLQEDPTQFMRALTFVHLRREGAKDAEAKQGALEMSIKDVLGYFAADEEVTPDEPETEAGKDDSGTA